MVKWVSMSLVGGAVIAAAVFGIFWLNVQDSVARAAADKAESEEVAAKAAADKAKSEAATATARESAKANEARIAEEKRRTQEAAAEEAKANAAKAEADKARAVEEREKAAIDRARAEAEAEKAASEKAAALAAKDTARMERDKAKAQEEAATLKAQAAADDLAKEKLRSEKTIAEAKLYELKQLDLANMERELMDYKRELDERERALHPEKTIKDLVNVGEPDDETLSVDVPLLRENDTSLPSETRALAKANRILRELAATADAHTRSNVVGRLERLYVEAVKEDRVVDADFYRREIKIMYPDWKYTPPEKKEEDEK